MFSLYKLIAKAKHFIFLPKLFSISNTHQTKPNPRDWLTAVQIPSFQHEGCCCCCCQLNNLFRSSKLHWRWRWWRWCRQARPGRESPKQDNTAERARKAKTANCRLPRPRLRLNSTRTQKRRGRKGPAGSWKSGGPAAGEGSKKIDTIWVVWVGRDGDDDAVGSFSFLVELKWVSTTTSTARRTTMRFNDVWKLLQNVQRFRGEGSRCELLARTRTCGGMVGTGFAFVGFPFQT